MENSHEKIQFTQNLLRACKMKIDCLFLQVGNDAYIDLIFASSLSQLFIIYINITILQIISIELIPSLVRK